MSEHKDKETFNLLGAVIYIVLLFWFIAVINKNSSTSTLLDEESKYNTSSSSLNEKSYSDIISEISDKTVANTDEFQPKICDIKWNISDNWEKIYHMPNAPYYSKVTMEPLKWERWFCTEKEAMSAWWRKEEASLYKSSNLTKKEQIEYEQFKLEMEQDAKREMENMQGEIPSNADW